MSKKEQGFTLIELLAVILIIGVLASTIIPRLLSAVDNARCGKTISDIGAINSAITLYTTNANKQPTLTNTDMSDFLSTEYITAKQNPWSNAYLYTGTASDYTIETIIGADCSISNGQVCFSGSKIIYNAGLGNITCG